MRDYNKWKQINPESCSKCKFGTAIDKSYAKAHCFFPHPKTKLHDDKGWICGEFEENV